MSVLVLGGARSGKSRYAESLAGAEKFYIATAQAFDAEMQTRIAAHRAQRGQGWQTFEAPLDVADQLQALDAKGSFILIDCLTLWISNPMHATRDVGAEGETLGRVLELARPKVVLVSIEVGMGVVPW